MITNASAFSAARWAVGTGAIVAVVNYIMFELVVAACFLLAGLLVGHAWDAFRPVRQRAAAIPAAVKLSLASTA
ncbi:hypothetical protein [Gemmatimonas sp.]|uniref:hypothetical protein n=1 Tax=Gemmatimonas sp. TaxID=1962908 RepID=UPI0039830CD9